MRERAGCGGATEAGTDGSRCPGEEAMGLGGELGQRRWDLGEMAFRDDDWYLGAEGLRVGEEWETHHRRTEHAKCITTRQRRSSTHTHPSHITHPRSASKEEKERKNRLATCTNIHQYTPPPLGLPHNPLLNSSPNTNMPYVASADSATGIGLRPLSARGIDDPPSTTDASSASSTPSDSEFWMRRPPRASICFHSNIST